MLTEQRKSKRIVAALMFLVRYQARRRSFSFDQIATGDETEFHTSSLRVNVDFLGDIILIQRQTS
jgi:hypothetical protein